MLGLLDQFYYIPARFLTRWDQDPDAVALQEEEEESNLINLKRKKESTPADLRAQQHSDINFLSLSLFPPLPPSPYMPKNNLTSTLMDYFLKDPIAVIFTGLAAPAPGLTNVSALLSLPPSALRTVHCRSVPV